MNKKLVILAILAASLIAAGDLSAWGRRGGYCDGPGAGYGAGPRHLEYMQSELGLSDQQVKQIFDIGTQYRQKYFENRNNTDKIDELRIEHRKAVQSVLTKEQQEKFNKIRNNNCRNRW
ncbi:MAG: hypothetical protein V1874_02325 [Spirochaetota bacterium]